MSPFSPSLVPRDLSALFERLPQLRVGIIGDFAVDLYYDYNTRTGEQSIETGLNVHWGRQPRASLGAAGNVVQNLLALGITHCWVVGCTGDDLFGREMRHLFQQQGVCTDYLLTADSAWDTCVYTKPMETGIEANRLDFGSLNQLPDALFTQLLDGLAQLLLQLDVLIINQQFRCPLLTPDRIESLNRLIQQHPSVRYVADLRDSGSLLRGVTLKVNTAELARFQQVSLPDNPGLDWCIDHSTALSRTVGGPLVLTRGEAGILYTDDRVTWQIDGLPLAELLDTVGAGDTVVAALSAALSAGASPPQALMLANGAAAVTVQKLGQTGTASPGEINQLLQTYPFHEPTNHSTTPSGITHPSDRAASPLLGKP